MDLCCKRGVGRTRALQRLRRHLQAHVFQHNGTSLIWQCLEARDAAIDVADPSLQQSTIAIRCGVAHLPRNPLDLWCLLVVVLEVPDHATGRLLQREPGADLAKTLHEAASAVLNADVELIGDAFNLKAGPGLLLCRSQGFWFDGQYGRYARASTFVSDQMVRPDQRAVISASDPANSVLSLLARRAFPCRVAPPFIPPPKGNST
jgi:hypothetical protein